MAKTIYLDNAATTMVNPKVVDAMMPFFTEYYGNPSSIYSFAGKAKEAVEDARAAIAGILGAKTEEIYFTGGGSEAVDFDQSRFNYYVSIFNQIQAAGDCVSIADYNGPDGDAANDSDWLKNMIECGKITIDIVNTNNKTGEVSFNGTSPSSDSYLSYTTTTTMDKTALAKAEAEYEHKTKQINQKDKKFDNDLSKLETERTALTTEYDSVKKVISDNIERTFGIFS